MRPSRRDVFRFGLRRLPWWRHRPYCSWWGVEGAMGSPDGLVKVHCRRRSWWRTHDARPLCHAHAAEEVEGRDVELAASYRRALADAPLDEHGRPRSIPRAPRGRRRR